MTSSNIRLFQSLVGLPSSLPGHSLLGTVALGVVGHPSVLAVAVSLWRTSGTKDTLRRLGGARDYPVHVGGVLQMSLARNPGYDTIHYGPVFLVL